MSSEIRIDLENDIARFTLTGRLDTNNAPILTEHLKTLKGLPIKNIKFLVKNLDYISSAGLRSMVFAKQKIGDNIQVFIIDPKPAVLDVIKMTGFNSFLTIQSST
jgi:anti-anti-sigma factor